MTAGSVALVAAVVATAIAVVVAIKGLGRFPELRAATGAAASERFIIGTLTSSLWAGLVGVAAAHAVRTLG